MIAINFKIPIRIPVVSDMPKASKRGMFSERKNSCVSFEMGAVPVMKYRVLLRPSRARSLDSTNPLAMLIPNPLFVNGFSLHKSFDHHFINRCIIL